MDESGNFDFSVRGTKYLTISALSVTRPFPGFHQLSDLKYDLWEKGSKIEYFHASNDPRWLRDRVFNVIQNYLVKLKVDSLIIEKRKTYESLQHDRGRFYKKMIEILIRYVLQGHTWHYVHEIVLILDRIPIEPQRSIIEASIKLAVGQWAKQTKGRYFIYFLQSKSDLNLQVIDYINWAIYRKWEFDDPSDYNKISSCVTSEFDVFRRST